MQFFHSRQAGTANSDGGSPNVPAGSQEEDPVYPGRESFRLSQTVEGLDGLHDDFLAACRSRDLTADDAAAALTTAIREGVHPRAITVRPRRDGTGDLYFVHGPLPDGLLKVRQSERDDTLGVELGVGRIRRSWLEADDMGNGSIWRPSAEGGIWQPAGTAQEDPAEFYLEYYRVAPDFTPNFGDSRDLPLARSFREANDRLAQMLPALETS